MNRPSDRYRTILICALLAVLTFAAYYQVLGSDFVNFDDTIYVTENRHVQEGLNLESVGWAFRSTDVAYWHPLTWLSHMADCEFFGLRPGGHHLTSLLLHILNGILVFLVLKALTGAFWPSVFVAFFFVFHPINADSVVWVAERKSVLSTTFWLLTMWGYGRYARGGGVWLYLLSLAAFTFGLMAKPMLVTLPFVLLILDFWPLERVGISGRKVKKASKRGGKDEKSEEKLEGIGTLLKEKVPFFVISGVVILVQLAATARPETEVSAQFVPMSLRILQAPISYVEYISKMVWPRGLAVYYPYPKSVEMWQSAVAAAVLIGLSFLFIRVMRAKRYAAVGWLWFCGTLVPVSGLYQAGLWPSIADRWAYVPLLGLFVIIAWGVRDIAARWRVPKAAVAACGSVVLAVLAGLTWYQVGFWRDGETLFRRALAVTENNVIAHYNLGNVLLKRDAMEEAIEQYRKAAAVNPKYIDAHYNLGIALVGVERYGEAVKAYNNVLALADDHKKVLQRMGDALARSNRALEALGFYERALASRPEDTELLNNYGLALSQVGRVDEAVGRYRESLAIEPDSVEVMNNLGNALVRAGEYGEAVGHFERALELRGDFVKTHLNLGRALGAMGQKEEAVRRYERAVEIEPGNADAYYGLGVLLVEIKRYEDAEARFAEAIELNPHFAQAYYQLGLLYAEQERLDEAIGQFRFILEMYPDDAEMHCNVGTLLVRQGKVDEGIGEFEVALKLKPDFARARQQLDAARQAKGQK